MAQTLQIVGDTPMPRRLPDSADYAVRALSGSGHIRKFQEMESDIIRMAIARYDGHMSEVARRLGIGRSTLYRKLKEFDLAGASIPQTTLAPQTAAGARD